MKNPFKKSSAIDTLINVGVGGAANVAMDYVVNQVEALSILDPKIINGIKIAVGAIGGSMTTNKTVRAAVDGIAVVGASNLVDELVNGGDDDTDPKDPVKTPSGIPYGTIAARYRMGQRGFRRKSVNGISSVMCK